jgi:hypothetical protein
MHNPLVEGWQNSADPHSPIRDGPPSVFGALPFFSSTPLEPPTFLSFTFSDFQPDILNCAVTGPPHSRLYFRVSTDVPTMGFTVVRDAADQPVVIIEWAAPHPIVEVRGIVPKQTTAHWLALSPDKRYVHFSLRCIGGTKFIPDTGGCKSGVKISCGSLAARLFQ